MKMIITRIGGSIILLGLAGYLLYSFTPIGKRLTSDQGLRLLLKRGSTIPFQIWVLFGMLLVLYLLVSRVSQHKGSRTQLGTARFATIQEARNYRAPHPLFPASQKQRPESRLVLGTYKGQEISLSEKQQESNVLLTAPVGSGKSSQVIIPGILREQGHRSLFIADLKGELYDLTAGAISRHHHVWRFSPTSAKCSQGYNPLAHINTIEEAQDFAQCWVNNTGESKEPYWANSARLLISALALHLRTVDRNAPFSQLSDIITSMPFEHIKSLLSTSPSPIVRKEAHAFLDYVGRNERLTSSLMTDIGNRFQLLASEEIRQATSTNDLNFEQMVAQPTAFYLSIPRNATLRLRPLLACLTMQMFSAWERQAEQRPNRALPRGMACYLDEFTNIGQIPGFAEFISSARSKRIALILAIQSFSQLDARYGEEDAETIKNNAVTHLLLPGAGLQETRYYSERIGDTTIQIGTNTIGTAMQSSYTQGETRKRLLAPEELRTLTEGTMLMVSKASPPMIVKTKPYFRNKKLARLAGLPYPIASSIPIANAVHDDNNQPKVQLEHPLQPSEQTNSQEEEVSAYFLNDD